METRGSRRTFLSFTRPFAELKRTCFPSKSTHTGVTCGLPSFISVPRFPKACFSNRSKYFSGITSLIAVLPAKSCESHLRNPPLRDPSRLLRFIELPRVIVPPQTLPALPGLRGTLRPRRCREATGPLPCHASRTRAGRANRLRRQHPSP